MQKEEERVGRIKSNSTVGLRKLIALIRDFPVLYHLNWHLQNQTSFVSCETFSFLKGSESS